MKKRILVMPALIAILTLSAFVAVSTLHTDVYVVDTKASTLNWTGKKFTGQHSGTINISSGKLLDNHGTMSGSIVIDMSSINNTDQEGGMKGKLEGHLKSADFFDVVTYPTATFVIKSIVPVAEKKDAHTHTISGDLTIKDKTNPLSFDAVYKNGETGMIWSGTATIDRSKYDVKYGSKTFFADIGDKVIYDDFDVQFVIVANQK